MNIYHRFIIYFYLHARALTHARAHAHTHTHTHTHTVGVGGEVWCGLLIYYSYSTCFVNRTYDAIPKSNNTRAYMCGISIYRMLWVRVQYVYHVVSECMYSLMRVCVCVYTCSLMCVSYVCVSYVCVWCILCVCIVCCVYVMCVRVCL